MSETRYNILMTVSTDWYVPLLFHRLGWHPMMLLVYAHTLLCATYWSGTDIRLLTILTRLVCCHTIDLFSSLCWKVLPKWHYYYRPKYWFLSLKILQPHHSDHSGVSSSRSTPPPPQPRHCQRDEVTSLETFRAVLERGSRPAQDLPKHQTSYIPEESEENLWYGQVLMKHLMKLLSAFDSKSI